MTNTAIPFHPARPRPEPDSFGCCDNPVLDDHIDASRFHLQRMALIGTTIATGLAHDINNMLEVISGNAELLLQDRHASVQQQERIVQILKAAQHSASLTRRLLAFGRDRASHETVLDLNLWLTEFLDIARCLLGSRVCVEMNLAADACPIRVDPVQLEQVVMNLYTNARDAMPGGGRVEVKTAHVSESSFRPSGTCKNEFVELTISDSGCGMSPEVQSRIFERFFTTKEHGQGSGLGLATVLDIVRQNGGQILVQSSVGKGTTCRVFWPNVPASAVMFPNNEEEQH